MLEIESLVRLPVCLAQVPRPFFEGNCNPYCNRTSLDYFIQFFDHSLKATATFTMTALCLTVLPKFFDYSFKQLQYLL